MIYLLPHWVVFQKMAKKFIKEDKKHKKNWHLSFDGLHFAWLGAFFFCNFPEGPGQVMKQLFTEYPGGDTVPKTFGTQRKKY